MTQDEFYASQITTGWVMVGAILIVFIAFLVFDWASSRAGRK